MQWEQQVAIVSSGPDIVLSSIGLYCDHKKHGTEHRLYHAATNQPLWNTPPFLVASFLQQGASFGGSFHTVCLPASHDLKMCLWFYRVYAQASPYALCTAPPALRPFVAMALTTEEGVGPVDPGTFDGLCQRWQPSGSVIARLRSLEGALRARVGLVGRGEV